MSRRVLLCLPKGFESLQARHFPRSAVATAAIVAASQRLPPTRELEPSRATMSAAYEVLPGEGPARESGRAVMPPGERGALRRSAAT
jgi:hypothetical protein